jgi:copper chaperone CopZ
MSCGGCVNKLEGALRNTDGVETVTVTLKPGAATIQGALDEAQFRKVIEENGFTVGS